MPDRSASVTATSTATSTAVSAPVPRPLLAAAVVAVAWCLAFAAVNVTYELTGHFADSEYAEDAAALSALDWLACVLKLVGAAVALLAVLPRPRLPVRVLGALVWGAFATLAIYAIGSVAEGLAMAAGLMDAEVSVRNVGYVAWFVIGATAYGVLAVRFSRLHRVGRRTAIAGSLLGPVALGLLFAVGAVLLGEG